MADVAPDLTADLLAAFSSVKEERVEPVNATPGPPETIERPASPPKRPRTDEPENEGGTEKRQKTEHAPSDNVNSDVGSTSWDISAMIQNALGSLDHQLNPQTTTVDDGATYNQLPEASEPRPTTANATANAAPTVTSSVNATSRKIEQRRMKFSSNPYYVMRTMSLPLLGSLAVQILLALSQQSRQETLALIEDQESEYRKAYELLKKALEQARRIFSESSPLLFADDLEVSDSEDRETLRMSNLAVISSSILQGGDELLAECHENFATIFIPEDGELAENTTKLGLGLKIQAFLKSLRQADDNQKRSDTLDTYFPANTDDSANRILGDALTRAQERESLASSMRSRRQELLDAMLDDEKRARLTEQYPFDGLVDDLSAYLQSQLGTIIEYAEKYGINIPISDDLVVDGLLEADRPGSEHDELSLLLQSATSDLISNSAAENRADADAGPNVNGGAVSLSDNLDLGKLIQDSLLNQGGSAREEPSDAAVANGAESFEGLASLIAAKLNNGLENTSNGGPSYSTSQAYHPTQPPSSSATAHSPSLAQLNQLSQTPYYSYTQQPPSLPQPPAERGTLPPNQSFPTSILYERARQAAVAKSSSTARREGIHSTRRAWTPEEEKALMAGLDMVKGPHWSQILTLFGQNGTMSDILKDRTQVQLKDKARNLKLFFLKTNSEMPYYLQCVTGELKTRAPSQAARKEAEEKARLNSEEEHARLHAIAAHAQGLHHGNNNGRNTSSPVPPMSGASATPTRASPVTPGVGIAGPAFTATTTASPVRNAVMAALSPADVKSEPSEPAPAQQASVERPSLLAPQKPVQQPVPQQPMQLPRYQPKIEPQQQLAASQIKAERPVQPPAQAPATQPAVQAGAGEPKTEQRPVTAAVQPQPQPVPQALSHQVPTQHALPQQAVPQQAPPQQTPSQQTPSQQTPSQQTPSQQTPSQQTPSQQTPSQQTPPQQTPSQQPLQPHATPAATKSIDAQSSPPPAATNAIGAAQATTEPEAQTSRTPITGSSG